MWRRAHSAGRIVPKALQTRDERHDAAAISDERAALPRGVRLTHDEAQGGWVLLAPERVFKADAIAAES